MTVKRALSVPFGRSVVTGLGVCALVGSLALPATPASAAPTAGLQGQLDTNFNPAGTAPGTMFSAPYQATEGQAVAIVPTFPVVGVPQAGSGNIVVADFNGVNGTGVNSTTTSPNSTIYEYTPTGSTVASYQMNNFDAQAVAVVPKNPSAPALADAGDIVVAGWTTAATGACANVAHHTAAIEVFTANLAPVNPGVIEVDCTQTTTDTSQFNAVTVDPAGKPVAVGQANDAATGHTPASLLARLTTGEALDTTFGSPNGYVESNASGSTSYASAVAVKTVSSADQILITGSALGSAQGCNFSPFAAAFDTTGQPVSTFGTGGMVNACSYNGKGNGIAIDTNPASNRYGDVIVGGQVIDTDNAQKNALFEWDANGNPVSGFNSTGMVTSRGVQYNPAAWNNIAYEPAGDFIVAVGYEGTSGGQGSQIVTSEFLASTGALNTHFGNGGSNVVSFGNETGFLNAAAMTADGSVVAVGTAPTVGNAVQAYTTELFGLPLTLSVTASAFRTSGTTEPISFGLSIPYPLSVPASSTICFTVSSPGASLPCQLVTIPAGSTAVFPQLTVHTAPVGVGYTVTAYTENNSGIGGIPVAPSVSTSIQHYYPKPDGYRMVTQNGAVYNFNETSYGGANPYPFGPVVGIASTPAGDGYWVATAYGVVYPFGNVPHIGPQTLLSNIVGIASTTTGQGFWLVNNRGAVYAYGDATYLGAANTLNPVPPVVGIVANPSGAGYWEYSSNGGVFGYGGAPYLGSASQYHPAQAVVGMAALPGAAGYWQVTGSGGVFNFGAAQFYGAATSYAPAKPIVGIASDPSGNGYWEVESNGGLFTFPVVPPGATFHGSLGGGLQPAYPITGFA